MAAKEINTVGKKKSTIKINRKSFVGRGFTIFAHLWLPLPGGQYVSE